MYICRKTFGYLLSSQSLAAGDLATFRTQAEAVLAREDPEGNAVLVREDGQHVMNLAQPADAPLPIWSDPDNLRRVFATRQPSVSDVFYGPVLKRSIIAIDVPVKRADGNVSLVLAFVPSLSLFEEAIR
ncbi:MAG: PDC sensor domain-containing protein [Rhodopila sp.]